jgi:hypothetical protein
MQKYGHFSAIPHRGRRVVLDPTVPHDGVVTSTEQLTRDHARDARVLVTDLERFWPSRRGLAFDELCR